MSTEGGSAPNQVKEVEWRDGGGTGENEAIAYFLKARGGSTVSFTFFDLQGDMLYEAVVQVNETVKPRKKRKELETAQFTVPAALDPSQFGLLEVTTRETDR